MEKDKRQDKARRGGANGRHRIYFFSYVEVPQPTGKFKDLFLEMERKGKEAKDKGQSDGKQDSA